MPVDSVSPTSNGVNMQDFLTLLLTQLTQQDPLKPMDNTQFLAQLAQFTTLQQTAVMTGNMQQLLSTQQSNQSVTLLGRHVTFAGNGTGSQTGVVVGVSLQPGGQSLLTVQVQSAGGASTIVDGVQMSQVTLVTN
jgi:flagellar basal-body rod modification protein FlgD